MGKLKVAFYSGLSVLGLLTVVEKAQEWYKGQKEKALKEKESIDAQFSSEEDKPALSDPDDIDDEDPDEEEEEHVPTNKERGYTDCFPSVLGDEEDRN